MTFEFSPNFYDFLQPKPPILWISVYCSNKNGQNCGFLGLKLLKIIKISKHIPSLQVPQMEHFVTLWGCRTIKSNNLKSIQQSKESELPETAILKSKAHYPTFLAASYKVYGSTITLKTAAHNGENPLKNHIMYLI